MEEALVKRVMPNSIDAEKAVLGSMLLDKEAVASAIEVLDKNDFYSKAYGTVFECMVELFNEGKPIDLVLIQNKLVEKQVPPDITSLDFDTLLAATVVSQLGISLGLGSGSGMTVTIHGDTYTVDMTKLYSDVNATQEVSINNPIEAIKSGATIYMKATKNN